MSEIKITAFESCVSENFSMLLVIMNRLHIIITNGVTFALLYLAKKDKCIWYAI